MIVFAFRFIVKNPHCDVVLLCSYVLTNQTVFFILTVFTCLIKGLAQYFVMIAIKSLFFSRLRTDNILNLLIDKRKKRRCQHKITVQRAE